MKKPATVNSDGPPSQPRPGGPGPTERQRREGSFGGRSTRRRRVPGSPLRISKLICEKLDERLAQRIGLFKMPRFNSIADYFIVATVTSSAHLNALENHMIRTSRDLGFKRHKGVEGRRSSQWRIVDLGFLVIHLMDQAARARYRLEDLWNETKEISWQAHSKKSKKT